MGQTSSRPEVDSTTSSIQQQKHQETIDILKLAPNGCPVDHTKRTPQECPVDHTKAQIKSCPVDHDMKPSSEEPKMNLLNHMVPENQLPSPGQPFSLSVERQHSKIPRRAETGESTVWVYPSEQMFWNAMLRKGWRWETSQISPKDMTGIIHIHNTNNDRAWEEIQQWEKFWGYNPENLELIKFQGLAQKFSPRARIRNLLGYELPFDRHDWIVNRNGKHVRYVLDYYDITDGSGYKDGNFVFMDIRPAFDSFGSVYVRSKAFLLRKISPFLSSDSNMDKTSD